MAVEPLAVRVRVRVKVKVFIFGVSNLGGELDYISVDLLFFCHICVYAFVECFRNIQVDSIWLLSTLATDG